MKAKSRYVEADEVGKSLRMFAALGEALSAEEIVAGWVRPDDSNGAWSYFSRMQFARLTVAGLDLTGVEPAVLEALVKCFGAKNSSGEAWRADLAHRALEELSRRP